MKKRTKIILAIVVSILIFVGYQAYQIYQHVMGSENLYGVEAIPEVKNDSSEFNFGVDDWPHWRGKNLNGKSSTHGIKTDWTEGLTKLWQVDFLCQDNSTGSWSSVAVQGDRLIVPGRDENNDLVFCLDAETGKLIWKGSYPAEALTPHGKGARATPFIDNDRVYTFGRSGDLVCWNFANGEMLWRENVVDLGGVEPDWGYSISPYVLDDKVIVQGGGEALIIAYDKMSGDVIWKSLEGRAGFSSAMPINFADETFLIIYHGDGLSCVNPINGSVQWTVPWETDYGVNSTTPIVDNDIIFFTSGYGMGSQAIRVSKDNYELIWSSSEYYAHHSDQILIDGFLYGYSGENTRNKGEFKCVELATGKEMWSTSEIGQGNTIFVDGYLLCMDYKTNVFLIEPNKDEFKLHAKFEKAIADVRYLAWTPPVIANGKLYLRYLQNLSCFDLMK